MKRKQCVLNKGIHQFGALSLAGKPQRVQEKSRAFFLTIVCREAQVMICAGLFFKNIGPSG
ncbi:MAG: hypothetical protein JSR71_00940 [Proteobacteria bacterium]|nr:hypothetical protein [Pseudomonadota bacterium]